MLPHEYPKWQTVSDSFRRWEREGAWDRILQALRMRMRHKQGRDEEPSAAILESQSITTSAVRGPETGYDMGKKIWGGIRHVLVETQGNLLAVKVTGAEISDRASRSCLTLATQEGGSPPQARLG
jgi:putative transposase